jgi:prevent-host-death family protein
MRRVTLDEAKTQLSDLVDAAVSGEDVFITTDDRQVVQLVPVAQPKPRPRFGSAKGLIVMADDFDAPLPDFDDYSG